MTVDVYMQERCGECADVQHQLNEYDFEYELHFTPPKDTDIEALEFPITVPVLVDEERAPNGIVDHDEILDWVAERYDK